MKIRRILISSLLIASVTASSSCSDVFWKKPPLNRASAATQMMYSPELNPGLHELVTDQRYKSLENNEPLRFETAVTSEEASGGTPVELHDSNGNKLSKMYDDGTHDDRIAGDRIYTCSYKPEPDGETSLSYTAKIGDFETEPASVRYFDKITNKDIDDMNGVGQKIAELKSRYTDSDGNVPEDKKEEALETVAEYAKELYNKGEAVEYRVNKDYDNVIVKLSSGLTMVYANPTADMEDGGNGSGGDIQAAVNWAISIANDNTHGYSRENRDGTPDYDCSSFVITAMKEGNFNVGGATYTGNMKSEFTSNDFTWIEWDELGGLDNLQYGDVLLRDGHTELYIGNGQRVGAHSNYDGVPGDGNGNEISIVSCRDTDSWSGVLRRKDQDDGGSDSDDDSASGSSNYSNIQTAVNWAISIANDDTHGYSQDNRNGNPDYDCSSFVIAAMREGNFNVGNATYTGNMRSEFTSHDFIWIDWNDLGGIDNLQYGDVLLRDGHTELYIGNGQRVGAHRNYDGVPGDGNGNEINIVDCTNTESWNGVLRCSDSDSGQAPSADTPGSGSASSNNSGNYTQNLTVKGFKPYSGVLPIIGSNMSDTFDLISSEFSNNIIIDNIVSGSNVGPHSVESFGPNQVIVWRGKGGYDGNIHSFLYTLRPFNPSEYTNDDIIEDRILVDFTQNNYGRARVCITSEYISAHCPDMTDSFVYLGCCSSVRDSVLAASFINKNCNVVYGYTGNVNVFYDNNMMYGLINEMCQKHASGAAYNSIDEALKIAKSVYSPGITGIIFNGKPLIIGNRDYRFEEAITATNSNASSAAVDTFGSLQLSTTYISVDAGRKAEVTIEALPAGYTTSDLIWTIDNENIATVDRGVVTGVATGHTRVTVVTNDGLYTQKCFINVR